MFFFWSMRHYSLIFVVLDAEERGGPLGAPSYASDIAIKDDCWLGAGVIVLAGVTIGEGCVIGAGSVVTRVNITFSWSSTNFVLFPNVPGLVVGALSCQHISLFIMSLRTFGLLTHLLQSIPAGHLALGIPARVIRRVTSTSPNDEVRAMALAAGERTVSCHNLAHVAPPLSLPPSPQISKKDLRFEGIRNGALPTAQCQSTELKALQEKVKFLEIAVSAIIILFVLLVWYIL
jgi:carbonic anhydrase/acetyltransferase-like protein (isoleucine patch superfamily)